MGTCLSQQEPKPCSINESSSDHGHTLHNGKNSKNDTKRKHRRSLSLEGSIDFVRKYRDVGGMTFRRNTVDPIDVGKHIEDLAYKTTSFLPESIVKRLPGMTENKKEPPGDTLPEYFGDKVDLVKMPYNIPSCAYLIKLLETIETAQSQLPTLKRQEEESKVACQNFSMYAYKSMMPTNIPVPKENWTAKHLRERDYYLAQCSWYQECADKESKRMKLIHAQHFYLTALIPEMKIAVENCMKVVTNQAKVSEEATAIILNELWNMTKSDIVVVYKKLKRMILKLKLRWEKEMGISRTKEALRINFRKGKKNHYERNTNCVIAKCCNGKCKQESRLCHKERFLNLKKGEMILSTMNLQTLIIIPEDTLATYTDFSKYDPQHSLNLIPPEVMVSADFFADEEPNTGIADVDNILQRLRNQMIILKWESYEVLNSLHELRNKVEKIEDDRDCIESANAVLPFFSRYNFESISNAVRDMDEVFHQIPSTMEVCLNADNEDNSDYALQFQNIKRELVMQDKVSKIVLRTTEMYNAPRARRMSYHPNTDLGWKNPHAWTYFH